MRRGQQELVVSVSRSVFWTVTVCLLLLPLSSRYKLLLLGVKTEGVVIPYEMADFSQLGRNHVYSSNIIHFSANGQSVQFWGPENTHYDVGEQVWVLYLPQNPSKCVLFSFRGLFLDIYSIVPLLLLIVWLAFYFAFAKRGGQGG